MQYQIHEILTRVWTKGNCNPLGDVEKLGKKGWHPQLRLHVTIMQSHLSDRESAATTEYHAAFWDDDWDDKSRPMVVFNELNDFFSQHVSREIHSSVFCQGLTSRTLKV